MKPTFEQDTIAAIATPIGEGAIAVIRISGPEAITACDKIFRGRIKLTDASSFSIHHGRLVNSQEEIVDEVLVSVFRAPASYTGENVAELNCHGGYYITQKAFETILSTGVRQAEPGEFTKRAFLNGRMDLSQAEAVAGLIAARSESYYRASMNQLAGRFSSEIKILRFEMLNLTSLLEIDLDFSEEGIPLISREDILSRIRNLKKNLEEMIGTYETGKKYREGVSVAIVGKPNAGKSSLFNALLSENRAIISETAGTTRDSLEENILIDGVMFRLTDTAGLRDSFDPIEAEGVSRTKLVMQQSDVILCVIDLTDTSSFDFSILEDKKSEKIIALNKSDIASNVEYIIPKGLASKSIIVSAKNKSGLAELRSALYLSVFDNGCDKGSNQVTAARHHGLLMDAAKSLLRADNATYNEMTNEFISLDIKAAASYLGEIIGEISSEDTLNNIFSSFCIGK